MNELVLSLFPGIGLLDKGFEGAGFCVVRGPDLIFGGDIFQFHAPACKFNGVFGGPPCQKFSLANRNRDLPGGMELVNEFIRVVLEAAPEWALMENVAGSPAVTIPGMALQLFTLDAAQCGSEQHRLRKFHFFHKPGTPELAIGRDNPECDRPAATCMASEGRRKWRRSWAEFCRLQGLPKGFDLPGFTVEEKYRAVGNGVPFPMALALARAIQNRSFGLVPHRQCACGCGQFVSGREVMASPACRKRMQRLRDSDASKCDGAAQLAFA